MRLIDAEKLDEKLAYLVEYWKTYGRENVANNYAFTRVVLFGTPTVDAVPVVHGEWTVNKDDILDEAVYKCSACGEEFITLDGEHPKDHLWNYCPNCGAKMDGGNDDA